MNTKFHFLFTLLVIPVFLAACSSQQSTTTVNPFEGMQLATLSNNGGNSSTTSVTPLPVSASGQVLFSDNFSDPTSGWQVSDDEYGKAAYDNGAYVIEAYKNQYTMWGVASKNFSDVKIDVDAHVKNTADNENNAFGVDCRVQPNGDGYSFHISSDGYYSIIKFQDLKAVPLVDWTESSNVPTGNQTIHLTALCQGSHLQFWVNDVSVADIQDSTFSSGDLSLSSATMSDNEPSIVAFTNFVATNPDATTNLPVVTLTVANSTDQKVCAVFVVDPSSETWGKNFLSTDETIKPGDSKQLSITAPGIHDVEVEGCDFYKLLTTYNLDLSQDQTVTVPQPKLVKAWEFTTSDPSWQVGTLTGGTTSLTNSDYLTLDVTKPDALVSFAAAGFTSTDAVVRTDAMLVKPADSQDATFGVMCRVQADGSGILFAVRGDGAASIQKVTKDSLTPLLDWKSSTFVNTGINSNVIEGDCSGSTFTLYVNGDYIGKVTDTTYTSGTVGLAGQYSSDPMQVDFDYLKVYSPEEN